MRVQAFLALPAPRPAAVLLDRLWPRGVSKEKLQGVLWEKDATPSTALRQWFHADPDLRFAEFEEKFAQELRQPIAQAAFLRIVSFAQKQGAGQETLLLTAAKQPERSHLCQLLKSLRHSSVPGL